MKSQKNRHKEPSRSQCNPDPQEIERRAYQLYLARGGYHGHDLEDWLQAERDLNGHDQVAKSH